MTVILIYMAFGFKIIVSIPELYTQILYQNGKIYSSFTPLKSTSVRRVNYACLSVSSGYLCGVVCMAHHGVYVYVLSYTFNRNGMVVSV